MPNARATWTRRNVNSGGVQFIPCELTGREWPDKQRVEIVTHIPGREDATKWVSPKNLEIVNA